MANDDDDDDVDDDDDDDGNDNDDAYTSRRGQSTDSGTAQTDIQWDSGTAGQTHTEQRDISEKATTAHAVRVGNRVVGRGGMGGRSHHMWQSRNVVPLPTLTHTLAHTYCILCGRVRAWHTRQSDAVGAHVELTATR